MLNYIWAGLIILSLVFALVSDVGDLSKNRYRNGDPLPVLLHFEEGYRAGAVRQPVSVTIRSSDYSAFYGSDAADLNFDGMLIQASGGRQIQFADGESLPEPLATIRTETSKRDELLRGKLPSAISPGAVDVSTGVVFPRVQFVKMTAITRAAFDFAETAVTLALGLIGALALWMGLIKIAEESGMLNSIVRFTQPVIRRLFPEIPPDHPALGMIVLNLTANMLGLGNAATPLGLKAMEELQKLNPSEDTATNSMVMLLALNTASVQLVPPVLLVAIMGLAINQLMAAIIIVTALSAVVAVTSALLLGRLKRYSKDDPMRINQTEAA
ncbi:MAG: nucleoside recognition domain-containing protein [Rhodothermales bacterium]